MEGDENTLELFKKRKRSVKKKEEESEASTWQGHQGKEVGKLRGK